MARSWEPGICNERSGFLFSHECYLPPTAACSRCQKPVCADHSHELVDREGEVLCTSCVKRERKQQYRGAPTKKSRRRDREDDYGYDDYDDGAYFYGGYYYGQVYYDTYHGSSRNDPNDFTEADAESLAGEMDAGFEADMSES